MMKTLLILTLLLNAACWKKNNLSANRAREDLIGNSADENALSNLSARAQISLDKRQQALTIAVPAFILE